MKITYIFLSLILGLTYGQDIVFPSGLKFAAVDPNAIGPEAVNVEDPKNTGSFLFDFTVFNANARLSLNVFARVYRSQQSNYFRAHPVFISCLQKIINNVNTPLTVSSGFQTKNDASASVQDQYARSGCGAQLQIRRGETGDILDVAKAALHHCPRLFADIQRDIGLIMLQDSVHIHMTGLSDTAPLFAVDGYSGMTSQAFRSWSLDRIDEGLDPATLLDCSSVNGIDSGVIYPANAVTPESIVGAIDIPITRDSPDFTRLVHYLGRNIVFENSEGSAAWCGSASTPCADCSNGYPGNSVNMRCADRLMSAQMYNILTILQKMTRDSIAGAKLKVLEAFDEPYDGHPNGDNPTGSLHFEGRAASLELTSGNTVANLKTVSKLAICAGVDFVQHKGTSLLLAVRKIKGSLAEEIEFPMTTLFTVNAPTSKQDDYKLPGTYTQSDYDKEPLFDSSNRGEVLLSDAAPLKLFTSNDPNIRYFRLNPRIPQCFTAIRYQFNKWLKPTETAVELKVIHSFMSAPEELEDIDPLLDPRYDTFTHGIAIQIAYDRTTAPNTNVHSVLQLAETAIDKCAPLFEKEGKEIGIGLYMDSVFIDMRDVLEIWTEKTSLLPTGMDMDAYHAMMEARYQSAVESRIVDPDDMDKVCMFVQQYKPQSPHFNHVHQETVVRRRKRAVSPDECIPQSNTAFCAATKAHRDAVVETVWREVSRKHLHRSESDVRLALEGCLGVCGTCLAGSIWLDKVEHCNNFLHWAPFELMNNGNDVSNFYSKDNQEMKTHACASSAHCLDKAPLFSILAPAINQLYRPDPKKSVEEELYSKENNPSPLLDLLVRLYGISAFGQVTFWTKDDTEIISMKTALHAVMLYNKNVTSVNIHVRDSIYLDSVGSVIGNLIQNWVSTGCPRVTREVVTPFTVSTLPTGRRKRSEDYEFRENLLERRRNFEHHWISGDI